jgi:hypothetical protein
MQEMRSLLVALHLARWQTSQGVLVLRKRLQRSEFQSSRPAAPQGSCARKRAQLILVGMRNAFPRGALLGGRGWPERVGFDQALFCKISYHLYLRLKSGEDRELRRLVDVLFLHGFSPSRDPF